ncbi:MAG TPA: dihydrofolate reductase family protein [Mycobacteriales bacterium]
MRKIVANLFVSLDGVVEAPDTWTFPYFDEEVGRAVGEGFASSDALLMGRVNYQEWAAVWPTREGPLADTVNGIHKYVVTTTLDTVEWTNSSIVTGDVAAEITALKEQPGRDIAMSGSGRLVEWLLHAGLLDELRLLVYPVLVGRGRRLFDAPTPQRALDLLAAKTYRTGVVDLTYRPSGN